MDYADLEPYVKLLGGRLGYDPDYATWRVYLPFGDHRQVATCQISFDETLEGALIILANLAEYARNH